MQVGTGGIPSTIPPPIPHPAHPLPPGRKGQTRWLTPQPVVGGFLW